MEIIATRKKEKDLIYVLIRSIILASISFMWAVIVCFFKFPLLLISIPLFLLGGVIIYLGIRRYKFLKRINKLPDDAMFKHYGKIFIFNEKENIGVKMKDIEKISSRRYFKTSAGFVKYVSKEGVLNIKTKDMVYKVEAIKDVKKIEKAVRELVEYNKTKTLNKATNTDENGAQTTENQILTTENQVSDMPNLETNSEQK